MKYFFTTLLLALLATMVMANPVSSQQARAIASRYMPTELAPKRVAPKSKHLMPAANADTDHAPIYIYSRGSGQGFVIVAGDDCLPEVLAVVEQGDWDEALLPPALVEWADAYAELIWEAQAQQVPARQPRKATGTRTIQPLCQTHWNQGWPYNNRCPWRNDDPNSRCLTGCVATAAAQVAYYWHRDNPDRSGYATPTYGYGSPVTESVPKGTPLRWDLMQSSYSSSTPAEMQSAVADLMFITGASTWLTYGSSTSGQISDLVNTFNGQYNLSSTCWYKSGNSQTYWEQIIIDDLEAGRPIVYSGVHPSNGGHAVVLDGYRHTDNLFHFNFGWGGQGDGWYTVDDQTGMNGFKDSQGMTFRIHPKAYRVSGKILTPSAGSTFVQRVDNTVRVAFTNHSTIPQKGIYLFCLTGSNKPGSIDKATRKDETTVVPVDGTATIEFEFKPTLATSVYTLYLTDANGTVLDKVEKIRVSATSPDLTLRDINVNGAETATETIEIDGAAQTINVATVYNSRALVTATIRNGAAGTLCQPSLTCQLDKYEPQTGFSKDTSKGNSDTKFGSDDECDVTYEFSRLQEGTLYRAMIVPAGTAQVAGSDAHAVYFRVKAADLTLTSSTADEAVLAGHWNSEVFATLASTADIVRYDLTAVKGDVSHPSAPNPNALFYVNSNCTARGDNIVQDGICQQLTLSAAHRFAPKAPFKAKKARLSAQAGIAIWNLVRIPFSAEPPAGTFARMVESYNTAGAVSKADSVTSPITAGAEHLLMSSTDAIELSATDAQIGADEMVVTFTPDVKVATPYTTKDNQNKKLAEAIAEADQLLSQPLNLENDEARTTLAATLLTAKETFSRQPYRDDIKAMTAALTAATELLQAEAIDFTDSGWADLTGIILNPSFESGLSKWTVKKATGVSTAVQDITKSQANYMANADGEKVLYLGFKANADATYAFQTLTDIPNGTYRLQADLAADRNCHVKLFANADTLQAEATDFGPCYFTTIGIDNINVADGTLTIGVQTADGWLKADNFRLYQTSGTYTAIEEVKADANHTYSTNSAIYDLSGRRQARTSNGLRPGLYVTGGKKVMIRD